MVGSSLAFIDKAGDLEGLSRLALILPSLRAHQSLAASPTSLSILGP